MLTIGITGGIGSGKSVIARICRNQGLPVYDCDLEAKKLMNSSAEIKGLLKRDIHDSCVDASGAIDRAALSDIVFKDKEKLRRLNEIVHGAVRNHFSHWRKEHGNTIAFVETAIPTTSHLDLLMDRIWLVEAPMSKRIARVMQRNGISAQEVVKRIKAQDNEFDELPAEKVRKIDNGGDSSLLLRIDELLNEL